MLTVIFVESSGSSGSHMLVLQTLRASRRGRLGIAFFFNVAAKKKTRKSGPAIPRRRKLALMGP